MNMNIVIGAFAVAVLMWWLQWKYKEKPYLESLKPKATYRGVGKDAK